MVKPRSKGRAHKQSVSEFKTSLQLSFEQARVILQSADISLAYLTARVLSEALGAINQASATNPDVGQQDELYQALLDEIQQLTEQQNAAASSWAQCWQALLDNLSGPREWLRSHKSGGDPVTRDQYNQVVSEIAHAVETYENCFHLPRPHLMTPR